MRDAVIVLLCLYVGFCLWLYLTGDRPRIRRERRAARPEHSAWGDEDREWLGDHGVRL